MRFLKQEIIDLLKSWGAISLIFAIVFNPGYELFLYYLFISAIAVGSGFIVHELSHKFVAQRYGLRAHFQSYDKLLLVSVILSFLGVIFIAPGAVVIQGGHDRIRAGRSSAAGPFSNFVLGILFLLLFFSIPWIGFRIGAHVNAFLGLFNLIPFFIFDGKKVYNWNKKNYFLLLAMGFSLLFASFAI